MPWLLLVLAGCLEVVWAVGLSFTEGFRRPLPSLVVVVALVTSVYLLALAARDLPIGTAYAVWVGIGAFGAATLGMTWLGEPRTPARVFFLGLLVVALIGLKLATPPVAAGAVSSPGGASDRGQGDSSPGLDEQA
jgi:quaternary ammonium compound-resistance protein SugE